MANQSSLRMAISTRPMISGRLANRQHASQLAERIFEARPARHFYNSIDSSLYRTDKDCQQIAPF